MRLFHEQRQAFEENKENLLLDWQQLWKLKVLLKHKEPTDVKIIMVIREQAVDRLDI